MTPPPRRSRAVLVPVTASQAQAVKALAESEDMSVQELLARMMDEVFPDEDVAA